MLRMLWEKIIDEGCTFYRGVAAKEFYVDDGMVKSISLGGRESLSADYIIVCAGPWNRLILNSLGVDMDEWLLGVPIFKFSVDGDAELIGVWDEFIYSYWRPGESELIGGVYDAFPIHHPDEGFREPYEENFSNVIEGFKYRFSFREWRLEGGWCGPISISRDYKPYAGQLPGFKNLYVISGLGGRGLMRGPALANRLLKSIGLLY